MTEDWSREFDEPIALPGDGEFRTLLEAKQYIEALRAAERIKPEWKVAYSNLMQAAEDLQAVVFAWIAIRRALEKC
jgi:hypothetical protein